PSFYGDGIAFGNGEVTLFELVQAYSVLANNGIFTPLIPFQDGVTANDRRQIIAPELASLMGNILSDSRAREMEFGAFSILNFPVQTAVKTGTSSDYRDSWAVGFNHRYTVGIWMGNLDQRPTDGLTGSLGPALLLRSVFAELNQRADTRPLSLHPNLQQIDICAQTGQARGLNDDCQSYPEYFLAGTTPQADKSERLPDLITLRQPTPGLHIAYDPRLLKSDQAFEFQLAGLQALDKVEWHINGQTINAQGPRFPWTIEKGEHEITATIWREGQQIQIITPTRFLVK
ncbi:MAG: penicillin-binding protein 1C, partial [Litorimonas sp.]